MNQSIPMIRWRISRTVTRFCVPEDAPKRKNKKILKKGQKAWTKLRFFTRGGEGRDFLQNNSEGDHEV